MKAVPLTCARHAANFAAVLESRGIATERYLERTHLPVNLLQEVGGDSVLSALSMLDFAESAATDSGIRDLGFWAGLMPIKDYGQFGLRIAQAPTLYTALRTFSDNVRTECSEANYYLRHNGPAAWFCHHQGKYNPCLLQHELYALMIMVQVVRLALGSRWKPAVIRLQHEDEACLLDNDWLISANIEFGAAATAIEVSPRDFAKAIHPVGGGRPNTVTCDPSSTSPSFPSDPIDTVKLFVELLLQNSASPSIETTAELMGISTRTLQRDLKSRGTLFSDLVDQVRFGTAETLLRDESMSITEIAHEVGYSNSAHFSRAFKRLTGMSPRQYRNDLLSGD